MENGTVRPGGNLLAGPDAPVAVVNNSFYTPYLIKTLRDKGHEDSGLHESISTRRWYGIVDGLFRLWALLELMEEYPATWNNIKWSVLVLVQSPPVERLFQMKRSSEEKKKLENCVEVLLCEEYSRLFQIYKKLGGNSSVSSPMVAAEYDGGSHKSTDSLPQKARNAIRLGETLISEMTSIMSGEHPALAVDCLHENHMARKNLAEVCKYVDCRVYRNFVTDYSLKQSTYFMKNEGQDTDEVRVNVLRRLQKISREKNFLPCTKHNVTEQFKMASLAVVEARKFEVLIGSTVWPTGLLTLKEKLLRGCDLDENLHVHDVAQRDILPILLKEYSNLHPDGCARDLMKYNSIVTPARSEGGDNPGKDTTGTVPTEDAEENDVVRPSVDTDPSPLQRRSTILDRLKKVGVEVYNCTWDTYFTTVRSDDDETFDFVLEDPPYGTPQNPSKAGENFKDELTEEDFRLHCERLYGSVHAGGYVFIMSSADYAPLWKNGLRRANFDVWGGIFSLIMSPSARQFRAKSKYPQVFNEFGVIGKKRGAQRDNFKLNTEPPYSLIANVYPRRVGVIVNIPSVRNKLKFPGRLRAAVRVEEKNVHLLIELLTTFCPARGRFFDGFGGTLTGAIAALRTGRRCVVVEKDTECFNIALERLHEVYEEIYGKIETVEECDAAFREAALRYMEEHRVTGSGSNNPVSLCVPSSGDDQRSSGSDNEDELAEYYNDHEGDTPEEEFTPNSLQEFDEHSNAQASYGKSTGKSSSGIELQQQQLTGLSNHSSKDLPLTTPQSLPRVPIEAKARNTSLHLVRGAHYARDSPSKGDTQSTGTSAQMSTTLSQGEGPRSCVRIAQLEAGLVNNKPPSCLFGQRVVRKWELLKFAH